MSFQSNKEYWTKVIHTPAEDVSPLFWCEETHTYKWDTENTSDIRYWSVWNAHAFALQKEIVPSTRFRAAPNFSLLLARTEMYKKSSEMAVAKILAYFLADKRALTHPKAKYIRKYMVEILTVGLTKNLFSHERFAQIHRLFIETGLSPFCRKLSCIEKKEECGLCNYHIFMRGQTTAIIFMTGFIHKDLINIVCACLY
jgi:hypothetical protein